MNAADEWCLSKNSRKLCGNHAVGAAGRVKKEISFFYEEENRQHNQQKRLNDFAVRVRHEDFVKQVCGDMKNNRHQNIALRFVIQPIHQDHKGDNADRIVCGKQPTRRNQIALIIILDEAERNMPCDPDDSEQDGSTEKAESRLQAVRAIGMPGHLFQQWCKNQDKPCWVNTRGKGKCPRKAELIRAESKQQGNSLNEQDTCKHQKTCRQKIDGFDPFEVTEPAKKIIAQFFVREDEKGGDDHGA